jgi:hypothetical protein
MGPSVRRDGFDLFASVGDFVFELASASCVLGAFHSVGFGGLFPHSCGPSVVTLLEIGGAAIVIGEQRPASVNAYPGAPIIVAAARLYSGIEY